MGEEEVTKNKVEQVNMLINTLFDSADQSTKSPIDQLAMIVTIRKSLSSRLVPIDEIHKATTIVYNLKALCNWLNHEPV